MFKAILKARVAKFLVNAVFSAILIIWSYFSIKKFTEEPIATEITFVKAQQGLFPPMITVCKQPLLTLDHFIQQNITEEDINSKTKRTGLIS